MKMHPEHPSAGVTGAVHHLHFYSGPFCFHDRLLLLGPAHRALLATCTTPATPPSLAASSTSCIAQMPFFFRESSLDHGLTAVLKSPLWPATLALIGAFWRYKLSGPLIRNPGVLPGLQALFTSPLGDLDACVTLRTMLNFGPECLPVVPGVVLLGNEGILLRGGRPLVH